MAMIHAKSRLVHHTGTLELYGALYLVGDEARRAIKAVDAHTGEPVATLTVNLPDYDVPEDCVLIKDWSENAGAAATLMGAGVIEVGLHDVVQTGWVQAEVYKLTEAGLMLWETEVIEDGS